MKDLRNQLLTVPRHLKDSIRAREDSEESLGQILEEKTKILIVDDNALHCVALKALLEQFGLEVDLCYNGFEAVRVIEDKVQKHQECHSLIFMDYNMPRLNGVEATKRIRQLLADWPSIRQPFICIMTETQIGLVKEQANDVAVDDFLEKPFFKV